jgi:uncharacterized membrane protein YphA (DoxX/SURF4 family)
MSISRRIARPLLASQFVADGMDTFRNPEPKVEDVKAVADSLRQRVPGLPEDTVTLLRIYGVIQVGAGGLLALGKFRRLAAFVLIGCILPATYSAHRFWEESDDEARAKERVHFLKNLGLLGGLILAVVDTEGAPSLGWRARRRAHQVSHVVSLGRASTEATGHRVTVKAAETGRKAASRANKAAIKANKAAIKGGRRANRAVSDAATSGLALASPLIRQASEGAQHVAKAALEGVEAGAHRASSKAGETGRLAGRKGKKAARRANKMAIKANKAAIKGGRRANRAATEAATSGLALAAPFIRQASEGAQHVAKAALEGVEAGGRRASSKATKTRRLAGRKAKKATRRANKSARRQGHRANQAIADAATSGRALAAPYVQHASETAHHAVNVVREGAEPAIAAGVERAEELLAKVSDRLSS